MVIQSIFTVMRLLAATHLIGAGVVVGVFILARLLRMPFRILLQDPAFIHESSAAVGFLSNLGIVTWTVGAAVALFASAVLSSSAGNASHEYRSLLAVLGCLTALMMFDDLYMIHDRIVPRLTGWDGPLMSALYAIASLAIGLHWRHLLARGSWRLGLAAVFWLGVSAVVDSNRVPVPFGWKLAIEDGAKFLGIVVWTAWIV